MTMQVVTPGRSRYIEALIMRMRAAQAKVEQFNREHTERKASLRTKYGLENARLLDRKAQPRTASDIELAIAQDTELKDAFAAQAWWRAQVTMLANAVQAEIAFADFQDRRQVVRPRAAGDDKMIAGGTA
jgi:hypothetical protein